MADKKVFYNKIRPKLHIALGIIALLSAVATLLLSPIGQSFLKPEKAPDTSNKTEYVSDDETDSVLTEKRDKNYTLFIYKKVFISAESDGVTSIIYKSSKKAQMTITPLKGTSYSKLCEDASKEGKKISKYQKIYSKHLCSVYESKKEGVVERIYCIDDGTGSSIEIRYTYPENNKQIKEDFDILLSMFKVLK